MLWGICHRQRTCQHFDCFWARFSFTQNSYHQMSLLYQSHYIALLGKKFLGVGVNKKWWLSIAWRSYLQQIMFSCISMSLFPLGLLVTLPMWVLERCCFNAIQTVTSGRFPTCQRSWRAVNATIAKCRRKFWRSFLRWKNSFNIVRKEVYFGHRSQASPSTFWVEQAHAFPCSKSSRSMGFVPKPIWLRYRPPQDFRAYQRGCFESTSSRRRFVFWQGRKCWCCWHSLPNRSVKPPGHSRWC